MAGLFLVLAVWLAASGLAGVMTLICCLQQVPPGPPLTRDQEPR